MRLTGARDPRRRRGCSRPPGSADGEVAAPQWLPVRTAGEPALPGPLSGLFGGPQLFLVTSDIAKNVHRIPNQFRIVGGCPIARFFQPGIGVAPEDAENFVPLH